MKKALVIRFLATGAINTAFGYGVFALLNYCFSKYFGHGYLLASIFGNLITITTNYITYKFFVFKTKGGYIREYARFVSIYGASIGLNLVLLPILVEAVGLNSYVAAAALIPVSVAFSFFGHSSYSFKDRQDELFGAAGE